MKYEAILLSLILATSCSDDDGKKANENSATNNATNSATNNATNGGTNSATNNIVNNDVNPAQQCEEAGDCGMELCTQIANSATYCHLPLDLRVEECQTPDESNECCDDSQCTNGTNGRCISPFVGYCGGVGPGTGNQCRYDECQVGMDCQENQVCAPAGTFGRPVNTCIPALCEHDDDCSNGTGGRCALLHTSDTCPEPVLGCTYEGDECRAAFQCSDGQLCVNGSCLTELATP
jgi:hypothetical protein